MATWTVDSDLRIRVRHTPTEEQRAVISAPLDQPIRLVAGAGTGKTETVANRFVWLVARARLDPTRILAITFTEKAASELERRISECLHRNGVAPSQGRLYVHTFHALCRRILSQRAYEAGLPGEVDILDEVGSHLLLDRVFHSQLTLAMEGGLSTEDLRKLPFDSCTELSKAVHKVMQDARGMGWEPADLDATDPDKTLGEIQNRFYSAVDRFFDSAPREGWEALSHLENLLLEAGFPTARFDDLDPNAPEYKNGRELIKFLGYSYDRKAKVYCRSTPVEEVRKRCFQTRISEQAVLALAQEIYKKYREQLFAEGRIDFNELLQRTVRLLRQSPEIRNQYRDLFQYVLVDEFQDTSRLQSALTDLFCRRRRVTDGPANLMITGDRKQSIYVWRYARPRNLAELVPDRWVEEGHALEFFLTKNFRSTRGIIDVANRLGFELESADRALEPAHEEEGEVYASQIFRASKGTSVSDARREEAAWVAETIRRLKERGEEGIAYSDVAVLVRDRKRAFVLREALSRLGIPESEGGATSFFEEPLVRDVIAYLRVVADPHDDAAVCRILERPPVALSDRQIFLLGAIPGGTPESGRRPGHLFSGLIRRVRNETDPLVRRAVPLEAIEPVTELLSGWIQRRSILTASRLIEEIARKSGILSNPMADELRGWPGAYDILRSLARSVAASGLDERVDTFVDILELYRTNESVSLPQPISQGAPGVRIMTIHQAKGLEFDACFTLGLKKPRRRLEWGLDEDWGILTGNMLGEATIKSAILKVFRQPNDEERRIAYVACTRAKRLLITSHCTRSPDERHPYAVYFGETEEGPGRLASPEQYKQETPALLRPLDPPISHTFRRVIETSFSALEMVADCPVRYWIGRYWNLPEWFGQTKTEEAVSFGRITGQIFHDLAAEYYTAHWSQQAFDPNKRIDAHLKFHGVHSHGGIRRKLKSLWKSFSESEWAMLTPRPADVERNVRWVVAMEGDTLISVRGRIDLIDRDRSGQPAVKDFKTRPNPTLEDLDTYAIQGLLYSKALGLDGDTPEPPPSVIVVSPNGVEEFSLASRLSQAAETLHQRLDSLAEIESARDIPEPPTDPPCATCCYALICPHFSEQVISQETS